MRVLSWNLFHGRAVPPAGRPLLHEFAAALAGWPWDVALLQEVPPWWPPLLARAAGADHRTVLTSRAVLLPVRRAVSSRRPDLLKANGGGSDAILVRGGLRIDAHARRRLRVWPERRMVHAVRLVAPSGAPQHRGPATSVADPAIRDDGVEDAARDLADRLRSFHGCWVGNVHAQGPKPDRAVGRATEAPPAPSDASTAFAAVARWADDRARAAVGPGPLVLGGDFNLRRAELDAALPPGWSRLASRDVDHLTGLGVRSSGAVELPARELPDGRLLSDHPPLSAALAPAPDRPA